MTFPANTAGPRLPAGMRPALESAPPPALPPVPGPIALYTTVDISVPYVHGAPGGPSPRDYALTMHATGAGKAKCGAAVGVSETTVRMWARGVQIGERKEARRAERRGPAPRNTVAAREEARAELLLESPPARVEPLAAESAQALADALAIPVLRRIEAMLSDPDPRIAADAARLYVPLVRERLNLPAARARTPDEAAADVRAAIASEAGCALVLDVAAREGPLRAALMGAGWHEPCTDGEA